jgi:uncharacterized membrane protein
MRICLIKNYSLLLFLILYFNNAQGNDNSMIVINKNIINIINMVTLSSCFSLQPHIKKLNKSKLTIDETILLNHIIQTVFILSYFVYKRKDVLSFKELKIKSLCLSSISVAMTMYQSFLFSKLIRNNKISTVLPILNSLTGIISLIIGKYIFYEPVSKNSIFGLFFIIIGSFLLY